MHFERGYSFTDCLSFATTKSRGLRAALTKDEHSTSRLCRVAATRALAGYPTRGV
jgi:predicted nucleic acid-binding protein